MFRSSLLIVLLAMFCSAALAKRYTPAEVQAMFVYKPHPGYPIEARRNDLVGSGMFRLYVDQRGKVTSVKILQSTGTVMLDQEVLRTFVGWRAKPGPKREVDLPVSYTLTARQIVLPY